MAMPFLSTLLVEILPMTALFIIPFPPLTPPVNLTLKGQCWRRRSLVVPGTLSSSPNAFVSNHQSWQWSHLATCSGEDMTPCMDVLCRMSGGLLTCILIWWFYIFFCHNCSQYGTNWPQYHQAGWHVPFSPSPWINQWDPDIIVFHQPHDGHPLR